MMMEIKLPRLLCPFPSELNLHAQELERETVNHWARIMGVELNDDAYHKLLRGRFAILMGCCHPTASREDLRLLTDFIICFFYWDDQFDCTQDGLLDSKTQGVIAPLDFIREQNELAKNVLRGLPPPHRNSWLLNELEEIRARFARRMPEAWMQRFYRSMCDYLDSTVREADLRHRRLMPDVETYLKLHRLTAGIYPVLDLAEISEGTCVPQEVWDSPLFQQTLEAAVDATAMANDVLSLEHELRDPGHLNMVLVLKEHQGMTLQEALEQTAVMHDDLMRRFLELQGQVCKSEAMDEQLRRALHGVRRWIRGHMDWASMTWRYKPGTQVTVTDLDKPVERTLVMYESSIVAFQATSRS